MALSCIISEIKRNIGQFFHTPLYSTPPLGGSRQTSAMTFGTEKLEWLGYTRRANFFEDMFIRFDRMYERDRQTNGQTPHAT